QGLSGGTTVSGTMVAAHKAGIHVFVTGGIGGVHRDVQSSLDISADLTELGRTPIAVVSAGIKSILDIGRTLEYLETQGVCVTTFGSSRDFPAFFTPRSGFLSPYNVETEEEAAELIASGLRLGLGSGVLIAVPVPERHAVEGQLIEAAIQQALREATEQQIVGKEVTPFILRRVNELTQGQSLEANIALIKNNADVGAGIACKLSEKQHGAPSGRSTLRALPKEQDKNNVVIGGCNVDFVAKIKSSNIQFGGQTNYGTVRQSFGGVGAVCCADGLARLGTNPLFISAVGEDDLARMLISNSSHMDTSGIARVAGASTATYCAVLDDAGELTVGIGDMDVHRRITHDYVQGFEQQIGSACIVCVDGNLPVSTIDYVCGVGKERGVPVWFEPTDIDKAKKPFLSGSWRGLSVTSPNLAELLAMNSALGLATPDGPPPKDTSVAVALARSLCRPLLRHLALVLVTMGRHGVLLASRPGVATVDVAVSVERPRAVMRCVHYPALPVCAGDILSVSGAGDSLVAGVIAGLLTQRDLDSCVRMGLIAASISLRCHDAVPPSLQLNSLEEQSLGALQWPRP
uniref:Zgc:136858 n=1 Tax=Petromyzon marinus TaxID=7757 RepID=S4RLC5_PETMA